MLYSQAAQLIYDGAGTHEIKNLATLQSTAKTLSKTDNHALAEYILRKIDYANNFNSNIHFALGDIPMNAHRIVSRQINHIHHNCQKGIEDKWQPHITDEQAYKLMFQEQIEKRLTDIANSRVVEVRL